MRVVLFGATGMIGTGVLLECLDDDRVEAVLSVGRGTSPHTHPKLTQVLHTTMFDYSALADRWRGYDACFFCLGVTAAGKSEADYTHLTYTLTLAVANALAEVNPGMTFCYVSGQGTDASEQGRIMWARVKGRTENALLATNLTAYMFRPGFVQPMRGVRSKTALYQAFYTATRPLFPAIRRAFPRFTTTTENIGRAMIRVAGEGYARRVLENADIDVLAGERR